MIDFRYHIVSLISVFLALAVGIVLGAGPLRETLGDTLTGQVEVLREEMEVLRAERDAAQSLADRQAAYLEAAAPLLVRETLTDRRVAVVSLGQVDEDARAAVEEQLATAGATVSARVQVTDGWTDPAQLTSRETLADSVVASLDLAAAEDAEVEVRLAEALAQGLTGADPSAPGRLSEPAGRLLELLAGSDPELITVADPVEAPADAVVFLTSSGPQSESDGSVAAPAGADAEAREAAHLDLVAAAQRHSDGVLVAGDATPGDLVSTVLTDDELAESITTVSGFGGITGQVSVPLGLNARIGGRVGHYGFGDGLTPVPEPVALPPVDGTSGDGTTSGEGTDPATDADPEG